MNDNDRFGLPLSLVEALRADPSPDAEVLADLLAQADPAPAGSHTTHIRPRRMALAGMVVALGIGAQSYAAAAAVQGRAPQSQGSRSQSLESPTLAGETLEGRWAMAAWQSSFQESVTGVAPDAAVMTVTRDDGQRLAYELSESRRGLEVARAAYDLSFVGAPSSSAVGGATRTVTAARDDRGDVLIQAPAVGAYRVVIHVRRTGPDSLLLEHDVEGAGQTVMLEQIRLVRSTPRTGPHGWAQAYAVGSGWKERLYAAK